MDPGLFGTGTGKEGRMYRDDIIGIIIKLCLAKSGPAQNPPAPVIAIKIGPGGMGGSGF